VDVCLLFCAHNKHLGNVSLFLLLFQAEKRSSREKRKVSDIVLVCVCVCMCVCVLLLLHYFVIFPSIILAFILVS